MPRPGDSGRRPHQRHREEQVPRRGRGPGQGERQV